MSSPSQDDMFEKYSTVQFEDDGAASEPSDEDSVERVRRMALDVAEGADDASDEAEAEEDGKIERIRPPTPTAAQRARAAMIRSCVHPKPPKECTDTCHPFHHGATEGSGTFGSGANVFTDKGTRRLAAVLNDRLTSDADRRAACTLIHTSCYDEANAKLVVDIDIVPQIIKIAKHDNFDSKAEACCALAVLAMHFPEAIVEAIPTLTGLLEAPAVVSGSAAWALSTIAADDDHRSSVYKAKIIPSIIKLIKDGATDDCRGHAAACLWNLACDDAIRPECMEAIDPLVAMAHECHSVDSRRRAAVALDCLMAYESFDRDWHLEKLNQPVIDRVKLAVTTENEKLIQKMIGECDEADKRYEEDLRLDRIASGNPLPGDLPAPEAVPLETPAPAPAPSDFQDAFDVAIRPYEPDAAELSDEERAWKDWEERSAARYDAGPEPEAPDPFADRRTTSTAAALAAAVRDAPPPPPVPRASQNFRTKGAREWLARTGFGTYEADPPAKSEAPAPAPAPPEGEALGSID